MPFIILILWPDASPLFRLFAIQKRFCSLKFCCFSLKKLRSLSMDNNSMPTRLPFYSPNKIILLYRFFIFCGRISSPFP